jgi:hypothetical protein
VFDLSKKEIVGISVEYDLLKLATVTISKDTIRIVRLQSVRLVEPLIVKDKSINDDEIENVTNEEDSIFGLEDELSGGINLDDDSTEQNWDMTEEGSIDQETNASILSNVLYSVNPKNTYLGITIPLGMTYLQIIDKIDSKKIGKRRFDTDLRESLTTFYNHEITEEQMRYQDRKDGSILLASIDSSIPVLNLIDEASTISQGKITIREISPEESVLIGLVRTNYEVLPHQYTCIIHVENQVSRIIFMQGREFHSILPEINEGSKSGRVVKTIFSKILFEVDRGKVPTVDRIVITGNVIDGKLAKFMSEQFLDVEVSEFEFTGDRVEVLENVAGEYKNYIKAIGAAWSAHDTTKKDFLPLSFIPKYVQTRQQVFKLDWHGYILLALIALAPAIFNTFYLQKSAEITENSMLINQINQQTQQIQIIADEVDRLATEFSQYNRRVELLDTLSFNTLKWSRTLSLLNLSSQTINGIWITAIQSDNDNLVIQGTSLYRDRIPLISNSFDRGIIQQVTERPERGVILYDFTILVTRIVSDYTIFKPDKATIPDDLKLIQENISQGRIEY